MDLDNIFTKGDIVLARKKFADNNKLDTRINGHPNIVLLVKRVSLSCLHVTTTNIHFYTKNNNRYVLIKKEEGIFKKNSMIDLNQIYNIKSNELINYEPIGYLSNKKIIEIEKKLTIYQKSLNNKDLININ